MTSAQDRCQALLSVTRDELTWDVDGRFGCVVAAFGAEEADRVRTAVWALADDEWSTETIGDAPPRVQELATRLGLRSGQALYTSPATDEVMVYGAWWPWGGGKRISLRVGADGAPQADVLVWFGLAG